LAGSPSMLLTLLPPSTVKYLFTNNHPSLSELCIMIKLCTISITRDLVQQTIVEQTKISSVIMCSEIVFTWGIHFQIEVWCIQGWM